MAQLYKKKNRGKMNKVKIRPNRRIAAIVAVLLISAIGTYFLKVSHADTYAYLRSHNAIRLDQGSQRYGQYAAGKEFTIPLRAVMSGNYPTPVQLVLAIAIEPNHVKYLGYDCNYPSPCQSDRSYGGSFWGPTGPPGLGKVKDLICLDLPRTYSYPSINLITIHLKALQNLSGDSNEQWLSLWAGFAEGTCATNANAKDVQWDTGVGGCGGSVGAYDCQPGLSFGTGPLNAKSTKKGKTGQSNSNKGTSSGGSSSSTTNSTKTNPTPSSSPQGATKQPQLSPSPFYDGKQYAPGSDPLDINFGNISVTGRKIAHAWVYLLGAAMVAGGGLLFWRIRQSAK